MKKGDLIFFSTVDWHNWMRHQQFALRFARAGYRVLFIEAGSNFLLRYKEPGWFSSKMGHLREVQSNIFVYTPPPTLPLKNSSYVLNMISQKFIQYFIKKISKKLNINEPILWLNHPVFVEQIGAYREKIVCYDCADDHAEFRWTYRKTAARKLEKRLLQKADLVLCSAQKLLDDRKAINSRSFLIPNGVEYEHFDVSNEVDDVIIKRDLPGNKPLIGFFGGIYDWVDLDLIEYVAKGRPEWNFFFIGPVGVDISRFDRYENVLFVGPKPYQDLPLYLNYFDVCIIPFKVNKLTAGVDPIKLYEYLAGGKPVVSTYLPEIIKFQDVVSIGQTYDEFLDLIDEAINTDTEDLVVKRKAVAYENSWDKRFETVKGILEAHIKGEVQYADS